MTRKSRRPTHSAQREFHVSRRVREAYGLDERLFSLSGNIVFADFAAARDFAHNINLRREPERAISASDIYALGLIDEALHLVLARHRRDVDSRLWPTALAALEQEIGRGPLDNLLHNFVEQFPPTPVFRNEVSAESYLAGESNGEAHREVVLEELVLLWLANRNPAFAPYRELFDDEELRQSTAYATAVHRLETFLAAPSTQVPGGRSLLDLLLAPVRAAPDSLRGQLEFIRTAWGDLLGPDLSRVLGGLDFLAEEHRAWFPIGPGPVEPPDYRVLAETGERYSADREWMPSLVLIAKNVHVWLAQLSRAHGRSITTLDGIPDEELARLSGRGFTGLWLIGVWQRSRASARIKRRMGDEEAVASAYSLEDYRIADDLGGESAYENLRARAWEHGIRLSTDMVPNHMGIDSRWVIDHPDWFLSLRHSPYPAYGFSGPDLSDDQRVGIFIEDHYWDRSDAAVVFKRVDRETGDERFVYHGNDGTSMPWNDTAQLDYLNNEVREAVIQTILSVARRSPVIRFDAAMTLARQHYHRLWFPEPGAAGAVPSRAEYSMTRSEFDRAMPREFWREVVDRVAAEAPDTLLLAEAFWLLEGYFVRTLGMHRVYNSAFMNMLRDERNAEYRQLIRTTLEFDPQILKRYVNFMSNPDERTAVDQFGTDDKYFGVATLMSTMPGLPMFGHGQIEGLAEKYGMEFERPRWDEATNEGLVFRHELQLFPLLRRRKIFAEVDRFLLYDLVREDGTVNEDVFAYSNEVDGERSLVVYHNRYDETRGWLRMSTGVAELDHGERKNVVRTSIADGLRLRTDEDTWVIFRDAVSGLEHLRSCKALRDNGFFLELDAYRLHCLIDFRDVVEDAEHQWGAFAEHLGEKGVPSVEDALGKWRMADILEPYGRLFSPSLLERLTDKEQSKRAGRELLTTAHSEVALLLAAVARTEAHPGATASDREGRILTEMEAVLEFAAFIRGGTAFRGEDDRWLAGLQQSLGDPATWATLMTWLLSRCLGSARGASGPDNAVDQFRSLYLSSALVELVAESGKPEPEARRAADTVELLLLRDPWRIKGTSGDAGIFANLAGIVASERGQRYLRANRYEGTLWFNREAFEELAQWISLAAAFDGVVVADEPARTVVARAAAVWARALAAAEDSGYRVAELLDFLKEADPTSGSVR